MPNSSSPDDYITVVCSCCHTRLHPRWDQAGKRILCPDCGTKLRIPWPKPKQKPAGLNPEQIGQYEVREAEKPLCAQTQFGDAQVLIYAQPEPPAPPWTFFSGVFQFPWYRDTLSRWIYLSIGLLTTGEIITGALVLSGVGSAVGIGSIAVVGIGFFILPIAWLSIWTFSYAAACCLAIVQDTAAGNDVVANWPESGWREWFWKLLYAGYLFVLAIVLGTGVAALAELAWGHFWIPLFFTVFVLFPIIVLSSLEANSPWVVASPVILKSLIILGWCWTIFYVEAVMIAAPWVALLVFGFSRHPFWSALGTAPLLSASMLIYARLLGRLGWRITEGW